MNTTQERLLRHHGDLKEFALKMLEGYDRRYSPTFWSFWDKHITTSPQTILDLGTGPGIFLNQMKQRYPESSLIGVDVQHEMEKMAHNKLEEGITFINHDLTQPPIKGIADGSIDIINCMMTVHELHTPSPLYQEIKRVLSPNGIAIIQDWVKIPLSEYFEQLPTTQSEMTSYAEHCLLTEDDHKWLAQQVNLKVCDYQLINNKKHLLMALSH